MSILKEKLKGFELLPTEEWDDALSELLLSEGWKVKVNKDTMRLPDYDVEIGMVVVKGTAWRVSYNWIPLWRLNKWEECLVDKWSDLYPDQRFFAIPISDEPEGELAASEKELKALGFATDGFEGF